MSQRTEAAAGLIAGRILHKKQFHKIIKLLGLYQQGQSALVVKPVGGIVAAVVFGHAPGPVFFSCRQVFHNIRVEGKQVVEAEGMVDEAFNAAGKPFHVQPVLFDHILGIAVKQKKRDRHG